MEKQQLLLPHKAWAVLGLLFCLVSTRVDAVEAPAGPELLYLEVSLSGENTKKVAPFLMFSGDHLKVTRGALEELGLKLPTPGSPDDMLELDKIIGVAYDYNVAEQTINLIAPDSYRTQKIFNGYEYNLRDLTPSSTGFYLNYSAFSGGSLDWSNWATHWSSNSLQLEGNFFSPIGTFTQSGYVLTTDFSSAQVIRQDTTWMYSAPSYSSTWRAGDFSSGALSWTAPIRMAGLQLRRNFATRPDIILTAMPSLFGSAALPSTVDILVNNQLMYTQDVGSGPFQINNLPTFSGPGQITMLVKNALGQTQQQQFTYFASPILLKKGLFDYSLEAGFARRSFGEVPFDYDPNPLGSGSLRYGLNNYLTTEFHGEGGAGLINGGLGAATNILPYNVIGASVAGSYYKNLTGLSVTGNWLFQLQALSLNLSTRRTFFNYSNLSIATLNANSNSTDLLKIINAQATDQATLSYGFKDWGIGSGAGVVHLVDATGTETWLITGSLSKSFGRWVSVNANVYSTLGATKNLGFFVGLNIPLGQTISTSTGVSESNGQWSGQAQIAKGNSGQVGDYGWQGYYQESGSFRSFAASGDYLFKYGHLWGRTSYAAPSSSASLQWDGSLSVASGGLYLANRINDSFAIVKAGGAGIHVKVQGRDVGTTGKSGKLLTTGLQAFQPNKINLDLSELPVMMEIPETEVTVTPKDKTGVVVEFGQMKAVSGAIVILTDPSGKFLPAGNAVLLQGSSNVFGVGMGGETYITGLGPKNTITSFIGEQECGAQFDFEDRPDQQQVIGPLTCNLK